MEKNKQADQCRIITPPFRVSYPHLFKASAIEGSDKKKFSVTMLFDKTADLKVIQLAIKNAKIAKFGEDKTKWPKNIESPVEDGDDEKYEEKEGYAGHWAIKATSIEEQKPGVYGPKAGPDGKVEELTSAADVYAGCFAKAQVFARIWEFPKNSKRYGVHFLLDHIQKIKEGKSFSSRKAGTEVFSPIEGGEETADASSDDDLSF